MKFTFGNIPSKFTPTLRTQQYATALWMSYNCNSYCTMWNIMVMLIHFFDWGQKAARRALQVRERLMFLVKAAFAWFFLSTTVFTKAPFKPMALVLDPCILCTAFTHLIDIEIRFGLFVYLEGKSSRLQQLRVSEVWYYSRVFSPLPMLILSIYSSMYSSMSN